MSSRIPKSSSTATSIAEPRIRVGTSGWQYRDWREYFYPKGLPTHEWLSYYARWFDTVEVNNTFYRLPEAATIDRWRDATPDGFLFAVKASRTITHIRRLRGDVAGDVARFTERVTRLEDKLGPVLFQFPPNLRVDIGGLVALLHAAPRPSAFEFRHPSWFIPDVRELLFAAGAALVTADRPWSRKDLETVSGWAYIRLHRGGQRQVAYGGQKVRAWAQRIAIADVPKTFVYFNNDQGGAAIRDAVVMQRSIALPRAAGPDGPGTAGPSARRLAARGDSVGS